VFLDTNRILGHNLLFNYKKMKKNKIKVESLFSKDILNFKTKTKDGKMTQYTNLDNAATTPPFKKVENDVHKYMISYGSVHRGAGTKSKISTDVYEKSRDVIKKFVNSSKDDYVIFSGNTTGAMNTLAYYFSFLIGKVAVSAIEHSSSCLPWIKTEGIKALGKGQKKLREMDRENDEIQKEGNKRVLRYELNENNEFDLKNIERLLQKNKIKAFVLTASSNATGYCPEIKKIGKLVHKYGAYFVVDACQYIQHHRIDMKEMRIDFLAASGHKFYAPYGGGFVIGPKKFFDHFLSYQIGGGNLPYITEDGTFLRYKNQLAHDPGTPNAVGAISMASALEELKKLGLENVEMHEKKLTKKVFDYLKSNSKIKLYVPEKHLNTVIPFNVVGMEPKSVAEELNEKFGIGVRAGSFCVYKFVRKLLDITDEKEIIKKVKKGEKNAVPGFIRASFSLCNTDEDANRFISAIKTITK
jgi:cysteine desulfurase/selenocysteine lyase